MVHECLLYWYYKHRQVSQVPGSRGCHKLSEMKASHFFCHMARPASFRWSGSELYLQAEETFNENKHAAAWFIRKNN